MKVIKSMITLLLIMFPVLIKSQQVSNLEDYSDYINQKKNNTKIRQERATKLIEEFLGESDVSCQVQELKCNFDVSECGFVQDKEDKFDWTRFHGNTPSVNTGPSFDHTTRNYTGYYMYIRASPGRQQDDNAKLYSPPFKFLANSCLTFYYHMYGANIGSLKVTINDTLLFSVTGDKGDVWYKASINISAIAGSHKITFEGIRGSGSAGDIAIDDFSLTTGSCAYDCANNYFKKYQDLPTRGAHAVEHFTINGSLFLAFANYYSSTEGYNTDSFIYKFNDSTGKFSLYQTIGTKAGHDMKYFTISDEHYLAVANFFDGTTYKLNSVIYRWNGQRFVVFQKVTTEGALHFNFFKIENEPFLAVCNNRNGFTYHINSAIYKWKNNTFEKFQEIPTSEGRASAAFVINNESYIAFASFKGVSVVYKWSVEHFVKLQTLKSHRAMDVESFYINDQAFLAIATQVGEKNKRNSFICKWDGSKFVLFQFIPTFGARAFHPFVMCGQTFLGVAIQHYGGQTSKTKSLVYRFSKDQFTKYQEIITFGAIDITSFKFKGQIYLAVANYGTGVGGVLYKRT